MDNPQTISLQKQLVKSSVWSSVFAGLVAFILLLAIASYQTMSMNDEIMDEITDVLLTSDVTNTSASQIDGLSEEFEIAYVLMLNNTLMTKSENFPTHYNRKEIEAFKKGYSYIWYDHRIWRIYKHDDDATFYAVTIQPLNFRFEELLQTILIYLSALIILWLLQWAFVHFAIQKNFKNIHLLSDKISTRSAANLKPIVQQPIKIVELQPIVAQINELLMKLKASMLAEQRFTADASHELRSPLSAIQMRLQVLQRKYQDYPDFQYDIQQIQADVNRSKHTLENLLLLARLDPAETEKLPKTNFNIHVVVVEVLKSLQPFLDEKYIQYQLDDQSFYMIANKELIYTCIRNLLDNAIRYEEENGHIYITLNETSTYYEMIFEDSGKKLTDDVLTHLGERFYRALGTKTQGTGLGLSICKKIVELHQGSIFFHRSVHGGLKASVHLPKM